MKVEQIGSTYVIDVEEGEYISPTSWQCPTVTHVAIRKKHGIRVMSRLPKMPEVRDYVDPYTFLTRKRLCQHWNVDSYHGDVTSHDEMWIPINDKVYQ